MNEDQQAIVERPAAAPDSPEAPCAFIDLDRFCTGCGYNLRTQAVYRDPGTGIPLVRCPECGRFQPANDAATALRPWLRRATSLLVGLWILTVLGLFVGLGMGEGAMSYATLDELTIHGGYQTQQINNTTVRTWTSFGQLEVRENQPHYHAFIALCLGGSLLIALVGGVMVVVVTPHWPRLAYVGLALALPAAAGAIVALVWSREAPHLFVWGLPYMAAHLGVQMIGGLIGVAFGRPLARLTVRIVLPSGLRPRLAYLWLADNKPFPAP